jgi:hypothetical protein
VYALAVSGTNLFATSNNIFLSTNNGTNWTVVGTGYDRGALSLAVSGTNLFAGTGGTPSSELGGVWRRPLSEMITSVENPSVDVPSQFSLEQNYPNPFNPTTTIVYGVRSREFVELKVFDVLGREVAVLVSEHLEPGSYKATLDANRLASGVYTYRLISGNLVETKKMLLLK